MVHRYNRINALATELTGHVTPDSNRGLPGVFFSYQVRCLLHFEIKEYRRAGWIQFFASVCAIVGDVVKVMDFWINVFPNETIQVHHEDLFVI